MSTCTPSVCPPPSVWGLGMLRYGYHSCKKIIRVINMWDNFSSSTPFEAVTNFLLLDTEFKYAVTMMEVLVPEHRTYVICNACTGIQNSGEENNYCAQCGRTNCTTIQKQLIPVLVTDGEVLAKPLITGKALKQLTECTSKITSIITTWPGTCTRFPRA
ncbi:hypothetical protein DCAR_0313004 [Daucus carota subsp. sativus]|uniref:Replication factor A C-terminal domain-containing protein n=1 Tax=Daucus carota subsp. sativus TaxID=79200 RepID=A0A161WVM1_DAUCS|nr:hypothetical protein DCAR_0313004 [Daucus carota subsp. sativus]